MQRPIALVIINGIQKQNEDVQIIKDNFNRNNINVATLINKSPKNIKAAVDKLIHMDSSTISAIICIIHSLRTVDGCDLDELKTIVNPLLCVEEYKNIPKLLIVLSDQQFDSNLNTTDRVYEQPCYSGQNLAIIHSDKEFFIRTFLPKVLQSNLKQAVDECPKLINGITSTTSSMEVNKILHEQALEDKEFIF